MNTGEKIKYYRTLRGMTQTELGNALGVQSSAIAKYEKGRVVNIKRATLAKLAEVFGVTIVDLLDDSANLQASVPVYEAAAGESLYGDGSPAGEYRAGLRDDEVYVKVRGRSMEPTLLDGDIVVVAATSVIDYPRQIALVKVNGDEATIKRLEEKSDGLLLIGDNIDAYPPHFYTAEEVVNLPVTIEGVVTRLIREVK